MERIDRCYIEITNVCNLNCDFCPKHNRKARRLSMEEFELLTDKLRDRVTFLYFHLMGEPMLHPMLPQFVRIARTKGFHTVLTSNGTMLTQAMDLLESLPHKVQLSLHSHESNGHGCLEDYIDHVMDFAIRAGRQGTCVVLRLWNQGGKEQENEDILRLLQLHIPTPWKERPDGYRMCPNIYLEYDRKFQWPDISMNNNSNEEVFCKALLKQIGVLADGSLVPCCLDHNGDVILGNLLEQSLDEILSSPRAQRMLDGFMHHHATEPLCQTCESALARNSFRGKARS